MPETRIVTIANMTTWLASVGLSGITPNGDALDDAIEEARGVCGRSFIYSPADAGADEARTYTGNGEPVLVIDDSLSVVSVAVSGATIAASSYRVEKVSGVGVYITRLSESRNTYLDQARSVYLPAVWEQDATVTVTGQWGYAATLPRAFVEAVCQLAAVRQLSAREWMSAGHQSLSVAGTSRTFSPDMLIQKRKDAIASLKPLRRAEPEPSL